ncbi:hypothetical protein [Neisseria sicca]|uniref:hypothetical protein n=1 Tax=Neisseria sicca TaxID=490 RepID=UPI0011BD0A45|nr:hypothetical protein [Neisseria sicca]
MKHGGKTVTQAVYNIRKGVSLSRLTKTKAILSDNSLVFVKPPIRRLKPPGSHPVALSTLERTTF